MGLLLRRRRPLMRLAAGAAPAPAPSADPTAELERLAQLHQSGALTDDEFTAAKARLLGV
jgi:hypothetical protein